MPDLLCLWRSAQERVLKPRVALLPGPLQPSCLAGGAGCSAILLLGPVESPLEKLELS